MVKIKAAIYNYNWNMENLGYRLCSEIKSLHKYTKLSGLSLSNGLCQSEDKYSLNHNKTMNKLQNRLKILTTQRQLGSANKN